MKCEEVREVIPAYVGERDVTLAFRRHLATCSACRAEVARYESVLEGLRELRPTVVEAHAGLRSSLVSIPDRVSRVDVARVHVVRNRKKYIGGTAAAVALAGAGALLWRQRTAAA
jgi:anti-sigma factor RsiW